MQRNLLDRIKKASPVIEPHSVESRSLPNEGGMKTFIRFVEVKSLADLAWWRNTAEPAIRALSDRSDREWRWDRIFWSTSLAGALRNPRIVKAVVDAADGTEVTVGVGVFLRCEVFLGNPAKTAAFTWRLSTLPHDLSHNLLAMESPKGVGRAMIEYVVRLAIHDGHGGRHWLHADRGGGHGSESGLTRS